MKEKAERIATVLFWCGILCELVVSPSGYLFGGYHEPWIIVMGMAFFSLSLLVFVCIRFDRVRKELPFYMIALGYGLLCYHAQHSALVLRIILVLLAGRERKAKDVVRVFLYGTVAIMLFGVILSALGMHNMLMVSDRFRHEEEQRLTLGFFHPNGLAFFLFRVYAMWIYLYGEKIRMVCTIPVVAIFGGLFILDKSKAGILIFMLLTIGLVLFRLIRSETVERLLYVCGLVLPAMFVALMVYLRVWPFPERNIGEVLNYWDYMNELTTGRLTFARLALTENPFTLLGNRGIQNVTEMGFANALCCQGAVFVLLFIILFVILYRVLYRKKDRFGMLFALSFMIYTMAEAYLSYFNKNGIWMLMLGWGMAKAAPGSGKKAAEGMTDGNGKTKTPGLGKTAMSGISDVSGKTE